MVYDWLNPGQWVWPRQLLNDLLPCACCLCHARDRSGRGLCDDCLRDLPWLTSCCPRCAVPLPTTAGLCGACQHQPPRFDRATALFRYAFPIDRLIQQLKFGQSLHYAPLFAELFAARLAGSDLPDCIIPVPLHPKRQRERGFNQAIEIARPLARRLNCRLDLASCARVRATPAQSQLSRTQRRRNLRQAFEVKSFPANHVALIDDVMTTGSTLDALSRRLREAGVGRVDVWVCARTVADGIAL